MPDYGAGPGPAVHTLHFTECASRLPAVLVLPITACSGVPGLARKPAWFWNHRVGEGAVGLDNGPGADGMAVGRMADRAAEAKNGGRSGESFSKLSLHRRGSSRIVLLRTGA